jgi:hypothetical protein
MVKLPIPMLKPFVFIQKGMRDTFNFNGIFEIIAVQNLGKKNAKCTVRRIATARLDCPLNELESFWLDGFEERIKRVDWSSFE